MDNLSQVNRILAEAVWDSFKKKRYGLRSCATPAHDMFMLSETKMLFGHAAEKRENDVVDITGCGLERLTEKINTL
jgi:hypothetical protein